mmetsp:Transcript_402/g.1055  ORF Transcript_402/g.1055 Transcript_402/m.1055 type:complete len:342 (-) Transcript_402:191-1216(-)
MGGESSPTGLLFCRATGDSIDGDDGGSPRPQRAASGCSRPGTQVRSAIVSSRWAAGHEPSTCEVRRNAAGSCGSPELRTNSKTCFATRGATSASRSPNAPTSNSFERSRRVPSTSRQPALLTSGTLSAAANATASTEGSTGLVARPPHSSSALSRGASGSKSGRTVSSICCAITLESCDRAKAKAMRQEASSGAAARVSAQSSVPSRTPPLLLSHCRCKRLTFFTNLCGSCLASSEFASCASMSCIGHCVCNEPVLPMRTKVPVDNIRWTTGLVRGLPPGLAELVARDGRDRPLPSVPLAPASHEGTAPVLLGSSRRQIGHRGLGSSSQQAVQSTWPHGVQ